MKQPLEALLEIEAALKEMIGSDSGQSFINNVHANVQYIPHYAVGATPEQVAAGTLRGIEAAAEMLRNLLNIPVTGVSQVTAKEMQIDIVKDNDRSEP
jgi:hypothetical protein